MLNQVVQRHKLTKRKNSATLKYDYFATTQKEGIRQSVDPAEIF